MRRNRSTIISVVLLVAIAIGADAQKQKKPVKPAAKKEQTHDGAEDILQDEKKVRDMVTYLGFVLNTLGNSTTSSRDKDVLVTESYNKIFRDSKVQVEDDLDEERSVVTNKDVVAYLKDINFFFKEVNFEFNVEKIDRGINTDNQVFYKVSLHRTLKGTTSDGKIVNNIIPRFIEINLNRNDQDLKIASIYTTELNEKEAMQNWWKQLSYEWQSIFRKKINLLSDSATIDDIHRIVLLDELDLSHNKFIQDFEPLSQLRNLKTLNLSNSKINDLTTIRNLADLVELNVSHTTIHDLSPLKYATGLVRLNISNTGVNEIGILQRMSHLQFLEMKSVKITDLAPIAGLNELVALTINDSGVTALTGVENLKQLTELNFSKTGVSDISPLKELSNLKTLVCDSTQVQNITALAGLDNLTLLQANHTLISDLQPLNKLAHLSRVYCDQTQIKKNEADALMAASPGVVVVYDSHDLNAWWSALSETWQEVMSNAAKISQTPSKEELARIDNLDSINISGKGRITELEPLRKFLKLRILIADKTSIKDLSPIREHREIKYLNISETNVTDLSALSQFAKLRVLKADRCKLQGIDPLKKMTTLEKLYVDESGVNDINATEFLQSNPTCLLIYKTVHLNHWWRNLSENWKRVVAAQLRDTTRESLHKMVELESFHFEDIGIGDLSGLSEFIRLKELHFSGTAITEISPVENLKSLTSLQASKSPIRKLESIGSLADLEYLDISDTPLEDLTPVWTLRKLKNINCAGTQIKRLDALEKLEELQYLDCSNTNVGKLTPLDYLHLKRLKCYNTRVSNRAIENFRASHPECSVVYYK